MNLAPIIANADELKGLYNNVEYIEDANIIGEPIVDLSGAEDEVDLD